MKHLKLFLVLAAAVLCFAACDKTGLNDNSATINDITYSEVDAYYFIESNHFFNLRLVLGADRKTTAMGLTDTPFALGEDFKGRSRTITDETGGGDKLIIFVSYPDGRTTYEAEQKSGTQTFKQIDNSHYQIIIDGKDMNGKVFKLNVTAEKEAVQ